MLGDLVQEIPAEADNLAILDEFEGGIRRFRADSDFLCALDFSSVVSAMPGATVDIAQQTPSRAIARIFFLCIGFAPPENRSF
ncbi:hypothetical protein M798_08875 [Brucella melitensis ADMAS-G1]|nr:hypothetical protein M798_08875 [Brucella melitensis ADMAS-G1]